MFIDFELVDEFTCMMYPLM